MVCNIMREVCKMINITTKEKLEREVKKLKDCAIDSVGQRFDIIDISMNRKIKVYKLSSDLVSIFYEEVEILLEKTI